MLTIYTTTITDAARQRGIGVRVIDAEMPIFVLTYGQRSVRCFNALTDRVGAATFHLTQDKYLANKFLAEHGIKVPCQQKYTNLSDARAFLEAHKNIVVKPCREWGGRGVAVAVQTSAELARAVRRALIYSEDILLEEYVKGVDYRIIIVDNKFAAAIERRPATVIGNGRDHIRALVKQANLRARAIDPGCRIPLDAETTRNLRAAGLAWDSVPRAGRRVQVRLTTNFHTGGEVIDVTKTVPRALVAIAKRVARLTQVPVLGVDFLADKQGRDYRVLELSPDLAISPPEGARVARYFLDYLFPETATR